MKGPTCQQQPNSSVESLPRRLQAIRLLEHSKLNKWFDCCNSKPRLATIPQMLRLAMQSILDPFSGTALQKAPCALLLELHVGRILLPRRRPGKLHMRSRSMENVVQADMQKEGLG